MIKIFYLWSALKSVNSKCRCSDEHRYLTCTIFHVFSTLYEMLRHPSSCMSQDESKVEDPPLQQAGPWHVIDWLVVFL
jgi:hypothetical protein